MRHTLAARTRLGQHFLVDDNIARKIARAVGVGAGDLLFEIGAGEGALTRHLLASGARVVAVELDDRAVARLRETFGDRVTVLHEDVLTVDFAALAAAHGMRLHVVGNIPYRITSPLLFHLFDAAGSVADAVIMMQREVADRLVARPRTKAYGVLAVATQFHADARRLFLVPPSCFLPPPRVTSAVVRLTFHAAPPPVDPAAFRAVVRAAFGKRRKTLHNALKDLHTDAATRERLERAHTLACRAEDLTIDEFVALARAYAGLQPA